MKEAREHDCSHYESLWTEDGCQELINSACQKYPDVLRMRARDHATARKHSMIWDDWGRILHVAAVHSVHTWVVAGALREAGNFPIQSTAQGPVKLSMAEVQDEFVASKTLGDICNPLLQVHDELLFECRADEARMIGEYVIGVMENSVRLRVPLKAEMETATAWGLIKK